MNEALHWIGLLTLLSFAMWILIAPICAFQRCAELQQQLDEHKRILHAQSALLTELASGLTDLSNDVQALLGCAMDDEVQPIR